jgi:septal ring factor EnvC (AmiA/AmiB activator)
MTYASFEESGLKEIQSHSLLKNGVFSDSVATPKNVKDAIQASIAAWATVPANMALIVRNEIKDQKKSIQYVERQIASYEQQLAKARDDLAGHQAQIVELEEKASRLASSS